MITIQSDKIRVNGPKMDGSYSVTFEVGEYQQQEVAKLLAIPQNTVIVLVVTPQL